MVAPLAGFFDTVNHILADLPHRVMGDQWLIRPQYIQTLRELGIPYQASDKGLLVDPAQSILVIDEPVTDILDRLDAPYQVDHNTGLVWVEPADLSLPQIYGRGLLE
jgi:ribulose 1,5-bisphosphate synthetase/thiazole synthase